MQALKTITFWLLVFLAVGPIISTSLVAFGHAPSFPVFQTFEEASPLWRVAFFASGLLALATAFSLRRKSKLAALSAIAFTALYIPSYFIVWGQIALGVWLCISATILTFATTFLTRREV